MQKQEQPQSYTSRSATQEDENWSAQAIGISKGLSALFSGQVLRLRFATLSGRQFVLEGNQKTMGKDGGEQVVSQVSNSRSPPHGPRPIRGDPGPWGTLCSCWVGENKGRVDKFDAQSL